MKLRIVSALLAALVVAAGPGAPARAAPSDVVQEWNRHAVAALINPADAPVPGAGQSPPVSALHMAMVQLAVYDAVNAIDGGHEPYLGGLPAAPGSASQAAAAATAAHGVLVGLQPALAANIIQRLNDLLQDTLQAIPDGAAKSDGIAIGVAAAEAMLAERANDGRFGSFRFTPGSEPGDWRPTPPSFVNDPAAWVARVRPFTLRTTSQFRTQGPLELNSAAYYHEFEEARRLGSVDSTERSAEQTALALYYTESPITLYNRTFGAVAQRQGLNAAELARLLGMLNVGMADAVIGCWDDKAHWNFWRPITAIHLADEDGNRHTVADPDWAPLRPNPPYPDHPSGYNCATGAATHIVKAYFGRDKMNFSVVNAAGVARPYERFTDVVKDTIESRMYLGIHFRTPDEQGAWLGRKVAQWIAPRYFEPAH